MVIAAARNALGERCAADDSKVDRVSPRAAGGQPEDIFNSWPGQGLGGEIFDLATKHQDLRKV